jgi:hypothetical protein
MMVAVGLILGVPWTLQAAPIAPLPSVTTDRNVRKRGGDMCARALPGAYDAAECRDFDSIGKLAIGRQLGRRPRRRAGCRFS